MISRKKILLFGRRFVGHLDGLDNLYAVHGTKRLLTSYPATSPLVRLRRASDNAELDFGPRADGWLDGAAISAWAGGDAFLRTVYDQGGNSRPLVQATAGNQPIINLAGAHPSIDHVSTDWLDMTNGLAFARNIGAVSLVSVRKHDTTSGTHIFMFAETADAGVGRAGLIQFATGTVDVANGRREDAGASSSSPGFTPNANWAVQIGRFDYANALSYHRRDAESEIDSPFCDAGLTSDTDSVGVLVGSTTGGGAPMDGQWTAVAWVRDLLTDAETDALVTSLAALKL